MEWTEGYSGSRDGRPSFHRYRNRGIGMDVFQVELFSLSYVLVSEIRDRITNHGK